MRNAHVVTIAPTGTISIIAGCSSGIEPVFSLAFTRHVLGGKKLVEVNPVFQAALSDEFTDGDEVRRIVEHAAAHGSIQDVLGLPAEFKAVFRTAWDVSPEWHVRMQAAWQYHTDAAVSKTVNLPAGASSSDVEAAFLLAYEMKCKGITVYRDGSRESQVLVRGVAAAAVAGASLADLSLLIDKSLIRRTDDGRLLLPLRRTDLGGIAAHRA